MSSTPRARGGAPQDGNGPFLQPKPFLRTPPFTPLHAPPCSTPARRARLLEGEARLDDVIGAREADERRVALAERVEVRVLPRGGGRFSHPQESCVLVLGPKP